MTTALNYVDLCFVVDTTGSMSPFIQAAQQQLLNTIRLLSADSDINLQVGLVEYRDHPPQDNTFVTRVYPLTADLKKIQQVINNLKADGGGDFPEAVYDGVQDACLKIKWRTSSFRFALLIGDAPPHGFPNGNYPNGLTVQSVTATAENCGVVVHAICMGGQQITAQSFSAIASTTGGQCTAVNDASQVIGKMVAMLEAEFRNLEFDRQVLATVQRLGSLDNTQVADILVCPRLQVAASIARLGKRGFLNSMLPLVTSV